MDFALDQKLWILGLRSDLKMRYSSPRERQLVMEAA